MADPRDDWPIVTFKVERRELFVPPGVTVVLADGRIAVGPCFLTEPPVIRRDWGTTRTRLDVAGVVPTEEILDVMRRPLRRGTWRDTARYWLWRITVDPICMLVRRIRR